MKNISIDQVELVNEQSLEEEVKKVNKEKMILIFKCHNSKMKE